MAYQKVPLTNGEWTSNIYPALWFLESFSGSLPAMRENEQQLNSF